MLWILTVALANAQDNVDTKRDYLMQTNIRTTTLCAR